METTIICVIFYTEMLKECFFHAAQEQQQIPEHAKIPTRPVRLLAAIRANSLTLRQSARWQQLAQSS